MNTKLFIPITCIILAASCRKELILTPIEEAPTNGKHPEMLWRVLIDSNKRDPLSIDPIVFENDVIASSSLENPENIIIKFKGTDGQKLKTWNNWVRKTDDLIGGNSSIALDDNIFIDAGTDCISLNMKSFETNWHEVKINQNNNRKRLYENKGDIFSTARFDYPLSSDFNQKSSILKYSEGQLKIDTLLSLVAVNSFSPRIECMAFGKLNNGDEIIIGKNRQRRDYRLFNYYEEMAVFAYNKSTNLLLWYVDSVELGNWGGPVNSLIHNQIAIIVGHNFIHGFNLENGQKVWSYQLENPAFGGMLLEHKGRLLFKDGWGALIALDPITGAEIWHIKGLGGCEGKVVLHNDKLFYASGAFWVISADNGYIHYKSTGADWDLGAPILNTPALDLANRKVYLCDGRSLFAIKMLDDW